MSTSPLWTDLWADLWTGAPDVAIRGVEARLKVYKDNPPAETGWCAREVMEALNAPRQNLPSATAVANVVLKAGRMRSGRAPRGAIAYWVGGAEGDGHTCFTLGNGTERSVDVFGRGTVGDVPFSWFAKNWPSLRYVGWSWWWGNIDTEPVRAAAVAPLPVVPYRQVKVERDQTMKLNTWVDLDLGDGVDGALPAIGANDWYVQLHLDLSRLDGGPDRNDLRYVKIRLARVLADGKLDTHGTSTFAIPPDLPKASWQSVLASTMKGQTGVPVKPQAFVGAIGDGTIVSPMRLFTVSDEAT